MADQAITALPKKTYSGSSQIASTDYLLGIDSAEGYQMLIQDLGEYIINRVTASLAGSTQTLASAISALNSKSVGNNAGGHNSIFRGKSLGSSVSAAQWAAIAAGTFDDLFIGDYWTINSIVWRIAAFNYWYNTGDTNCTTPHVVIVPDSNLLNSDGSTTHWMNTSNTTEGGYMGTGWYTGENADGTANTGKSQCLSKAESAFGSRHILQHREYLSNAVVNGYASGGTRTDSKIELMNESMVYGNRFFENVINGTNIPAAYTIDKGQLPLFALAPQYICNRANWWLRSVVSSVHFACVGDTGDCDYHAASNAWHGLRPAFGIK